MIPCQSHFTQVTAIQTGTGDILIVHSQSQTSRTASFLVSLQRSFRLCTSGHCFRGRFLALVLAVSVSLVKYSGSFDTVSSCHSKCCGCMLLKILNPCSCTLFCSCIDKKKWLRMLCLMDACS